MQDFKLSKDIVYKVSKAKKEPKWMLDFRLKALDAFNEKPMPKFGPDLSRLDFSKLDFDILQPQLDKLIYKEDLLKLGFKESDEDKDELIIRYNEHSNRDNEIELIALADRFEYKWKEYEVYYDFYFSNNLDQTLNIQNLQDIKDFLRIFWNWKE